MREAIVHAFALALWFFTASGLVYFGLNGVLGWLGLPRVPFASVLWGCLALRGLGSIWRGFVMGDDRKQEGGCGGVLG